jgi:hypothetical protein
MEMALISIDYRQADNECKRFLKVREAMAGHRFRLFLQRISGFGRNSRCHWWNRNADFSGHF